MIYLVHMCHQQCRLPSRQQMSNVVTAYEALLRGQ
jgi:hypothetical protein